MKKIILSLILAAAASFSFADTPDSLKKDLEDYDYLVSFVEQNYAPFDAIMQKGYKREYKALKKQLRKQLSKGDANLERTRVPQKALPNSSRSTVAVLRFMESETLMVAN